MQANGNKFFVIYKLGIQTNINSLVEQCFNDLNYIISNGMMNGNCFDYTKGVNLTEGDSQEFNKLIDSISFLITNITP